MKKISFVFTLAILAITMTNAQNIDIEKSVVKFQIKNMKVRTVEGTFSGMKGDIRFDENDLANATFSVSIDAASVNTENEKRDDHLRNEDYFHVEEYPLITFESSVISAASEGYTAKGILSMHGISKEIEIPFTYSESQFTGSLELNRFDYKIAEDTKTSMVDETVNMEIIAVLN